MITYLIGHKLTAHPVLIGFCHKPLPWKQRGISQRSSVEQTGGALLNWWKVELRGQRRLVEGFFMGSVISFGQCQRAGRIRWGLGKQEGEITGGRWQLSGDSFVLWTLLHQINHMNKLQLWRDALEMSRVMSHRWGSWGFPKYFWMQA